MNDILSLLLAALGGAACGAAFFGGLWWTIQHALQSPTAALWFFASTLIRSGGTIATFAWMAHGDLKRALACIAGFFVARVTGQILGRFPRPVRPPANHVVGFSR